ncbi:MarC family protein, partial [Saliniramus sp.]|uniref:MarC family protein n=1 Tax=Saliniramus sp. TaxID=2986772 RepID=UPI002C381E8A
MDFGFLWTALVTMLVTLDPLGLAPIFISLTAGMDAGQRRRIAARACLIALAILTFFGLGGQFLLDALGIGLPAFRIAGGLLLFYIAFEMTFELRAKRKQRTAVRGANQPDAEKHLAAFPLAIPLLAGPGAITATILLAGRVQGDLPNALGLAGVITLGVAICFGT